MKTCYYYFIYRNCKLHCNRWVSIACSAPNCPHCPYALLSCYWFVSSEIDNVLTRSKPQCTCDAGGARVPSQHLPGPPMRIIQIRWVFIRWWGKCIFLKCENTFFIWVYCHIHIGDDLRHIYSYIQSVPSQAGAVTTRPQWRTIVILVSKISRGRTTQALKHDHTQYVCNALRVWKPMQILQGMCNVIKTLQAKNQPSSRIQHRLNSCCCWTRPQGKRPRTRIFEHSLVEYGQRFARSCLKSDPFTTLGHIIENYYFCLLML